MSDQEGNRPDGKRPDGKRPERNRPDEDLQGWTLTEVAETGSTNDDLLQLARAGQLGDRTVLRTDHQTAGRGRLDRRWDAPPGTNLLTSVFFVDGENGADQAGEQLRRIGVSIVDAVTGLAADSDGAGLGLKWPNDVLLGGIKLAGILAQRSDGTGNGNGNGNANGVGGTIVGFGVNVSWAPDGGVKIADLDDTIGPAALLREILCAYDRLPINGTAFAERYRSALLTLGQRVRVHLPGDASFDGTAIDIDGSGRLVVEGGTGAAKQTRVFDVGDVVHLRPTTG